MRKFLLALCAATSLLPLLAGGEARAQSTQPAYAFGATKSVAVSISSATTTKLVSNISGKWIYVSEFVLVSSGIGTVQFEYGTKTTNECDTGTTTLTGAFAVVANTQVSSGDGNGFILFVPAGNDLCLVTASAATAQGSLAFSQW